MRINGDRWTKLYRLFSVNKNKHKVVFDLGLKLKIKNALKHIHTYHKRGPAPPPLGLIFGPVNGLNYLITNLFYFSYFGTFSSKCVRQRLGWALRV